MSKDHKPSLLNPRWRKVFSDLWEDRTRTGLVVASIAVGVFAIGMIITAYVILNDDIDRSYAAVNPPNIEIWTDPFDSKLVETVATLPGVRAVDGRRVLRVRARRAGENWQGLVLIGLTNFKDNINRLAPIDGVATPHDDEVVVSQNLMASTGFHVGDTIEVELPDDTKHTLKVVGLITDQTTSKPEPNPTSNAFVTLDTLESFGQGDSYNQFYITITGDGGDLAAIGAVADAVTERIEKNQRTVYLTDTLVSSEHPMTTTILAVIGVLGALGALITILSSSLIVNTLNALLAQQLRQIGIMKLVGARSSQIMGMYLVLIIAYGLVSLVLAVPLGALAGYTLAWVIASLMGAVLQGFRVIPLAVGVQILIAILVPLAAGYFPVHSGAQTSVQQAISNYRPVTQASGGRGFRFGAEWMSHLSRPLLVSLRNTFRKRERLVLTIFTLTVAGAVFIAVFNVRDSLNHVMDQLMQHFQGDVTITFRQPYRVDEVERDLLAIPGVVGVEAWGGSIGELWDAQDELVTHFSIAAPPQGTGLLQPDFVAGRWLLPGEKQALVVSDTIYKYYPNLQPGDSVIVKLPGRREEPWRIVGVFRFVDLLGDPIAYADFSFMADELNLRKRAASYRISMAVHDAASQQELARRVDAYLRTQDFSVQNVQAGAVMRAKATQGVSVLVIFLLIMALLTAFVGSIGLTGTMSLNVLERTRELGVMRTIGAVDLAIIQSVIIEGLMIGLITWLLAIVLSFPISFLLLQIVGEAMLGSAMTLHFTPIGIVLWLGVVLALSVFASIMPARSAARLTINEVLAYE